MPGNKRQRCFERRRNKAESSIYRTSELHVNTATIHQPIDDGSQPVDDQHSEQQQHSDVAAGSRSSAPRTATTSADVCSPTPSLDAGFSKRDSRLSRPEIDTPASAPGNQLHPSDAPTSKFSLLSTFGFSSLEPKFVSLPYPDGQREPVLRVRIVRLQYARWLFAVPEQSILRNPGRPDEQQQQQPDSVSPDFRIPPPPSSGSSSASHRGPIVSRLMEKIESKKLTSTKSSNKIIQFTCEGYLLTILEEKNLICWHLCILIMIKYIL